MDVFARIDEARRECNVLEHPFYERWSAGELTAKELGFYAGQYHHAVEALAQASSLAAAKAGVEQHAGLERHAAEEHSHIVLWEQFAKAAAAAGGQTPGEPSAAEAHSGAAHRPLAETTHQPLAETEECARVWTAGDDLLEHLAVLYAIEASQPEIAQTKLEGLVERYGYSPEGPAVEYFKLHSTLDVEHARQARELIGELMSSDEAQAREQAERMVARAKAALRGNWTLLDGVDRQFAQVS